MAAQRPGFEGTAHGFPALRDASGKKRADGDFVQWLENERLHVRIRYDFGRGRSIEERAVFRQAPRLLQDTWSFRELGNGRIYRSFEVDVEPGRTFAGFGFTLAIKGLRDRLVKGERIELQAIGFTPKPRVVAVEISHGGIDRMQMSGRVLRGDRFVVHPKIPWIAKLFVNVPDTHIWLTILRPQGFCDGKVRFQNPTMP